MQFIIGHYRPVIRTWSSQEGTTDKNQEAVLLVGPTASTKGLWATEGTVKVLKLQNPEITPGDPGHCTGSQRSAPLRWAHGNSRRK